MSCQSSGAGCTICRKFAVATSLVFAVTSVLAWIVAPVEPIEVLVAPKDLPIGTMFGRDELGEMVKLKNDPQPNIIADKEDFVGKRIDRPS